MLDSDLMQYKKKIMSLLIQNENIVSAIDEPDLSPDELIYNNIFPFLKVPKTQEEAKCYVTMKVDTTNIQRNEIYKNFVITICVLCHESKMCTPYGGIRTDVIAGEIVRLLNWREDIGFTLELTSDTESILNEDYHIRQLVFETITSNSMENGVKINAYR